MISFFQRMDFQHFYLSNSIWDRITQTKMDE